MKRAFGVVCIICAIYLSALVIGFYRYAINEQDELQQLIMSFAIDYSSDAAMQETLTGDDLETDYSEDGHVLVDPKLALDTFVDMFCLNYDIGISSETRTHVLLNYIPAACVAGYDGYYIATCQPVRSDTDIYYSTEGDGVNAVNGRWDVVFGPKLPYTYVYGGESYALNMGMDYAYLTDGRKYEAMPPGLLNKDHGFAEINRRVSDEIAYAVDNANKTNQNWRHSFFIPTQLSPLSGVNPIKGPSLIVLVQNVDLRTVRPISGFSIAGTRIERARMVVGYIRNGIKYYCYADKAPSLDKVQDNEMKEFFTNVNDAAKAGYYYDLEYMR